jgi:hypothetical protein
LPGLKRKFLEFQARSAFFGCNRGQKIHFISNALHAHFQLIGSSKTRLAQGDYPILGIARCFEVLSFNRCSPPGNSLHRACLVALSSSSDKLASGDSDGWFYALVSLSRAAFEFLALAVRVSPTPRIKTYSEKGRKELVRH